MGALAADFSWTTEDDFMLKKAAEVGVSFESLARGAVRFSQSFTIQELQDRWHALLYDPIVSADASTRILEFEHSSSTPISKSNHLDNHGENTSVSGKRKIETVRQRFYAMRKKTRDHISFSNATFNNNIIGNEGCLQDADADVNLDVNGTVNDTCVTYAEDNDPVEESDEFKEIYDLLEDEVTEFTAVIDQPHIDKLNEYPIIGDQTVECGAEMQNPITTSTNADNYLMEISNTLFDFTMEEELPLMDADGNIIDKSYIDGLSSLLLDSPNKGTIVSTAPVEDEYLNNHYAACHEQFSNHYASGMNCKSLNSVMICTLNTEDPEIPSNDDVFLLPLGSFLSSGDYSASWKKDYRVPKQIIKKDNMYEQSQFSSPMIGSQLRSELLDHRIKQDLPNNDGQHVICGKSSLPCKDQSQVHTEIIRRSNHFPASIKSDSIALEKKTSGHDILTNGPQLNATVGNHDMHQQREALHGEIVSMEARHSLMDEEVLSSLSDDDIPNFSDVEAMILDKDLSPDEQILYLNGTESSHHLPTLKYEETDIQKKIIRWEQAADAFVKRDMTSRGAFAIFQGCRIKYYVKKPEVLIGRATEDVNVDIDLGREGRNCRVSRRQAVIRMDEEGSFHMKNLSKYSVFVNSVELATNQRITLPSSCLIEIRGMPFLFETNEACIKQYIHNIKNLTNTEDKS